VILQKFNRIFATNLNFDALSENRFYFVFNVQICMYEASFLLSDERWYLDRLPSIQAMMMVQPTIRHDYAIFPNWTSGAGNTFDSGLRVGRPAESNAIPLALALALLVHKLLLSDVIS
jgi:hypothetical protein